MKRLFIFFLCLCLVLGLAACAKDSGEVKELAGAKESGVLRIGVTDCPPFASYADGKWSGFDIALAQSVCEKLGVEPEFIEVEWIDKYSALSNDRVDCLWSAVTKNETMVEDITYSQTYLASPLVLVCRGVTAPASIAAERNSAAALAAQAYAPEAELTETAGAWVSLALVRGLVEIESTQGAVVDVIFTRDLEGTGLSILQPNALGIEEFAAAFRKDSDLVPAVNKALSELEQNGTLQNLAERYGMLDHLIVG